MRIYYTDGHIEECAYGIRGMARAIAGMYPDKGEPVTVVSYQIAGRDY